MVKKENVSNIVKHGLCMGCGICQDACPKKCIRILHSNRYIRPIVEEDQCINCGLCLKSCPGKGVLLKEEADSLFEAEKDQYIGAYYRSYTGWSLDEDIRYHSASGGTVTQFLIFLLEKKIIDGVAVVGFSDKNIMLSQAYIARTKEEIIAAKSSKYCTTSYEGLASEIKSSLGRYVIVGLPCHIQAFRLIEKNSKLLSNSIIGHFAIYCSVNKINLSAEYYCERYKFPYQRIKKFAYRDDGYMGFMKFEGKDGTVKKVPYVHFWLGTHSFFINKRCLLCNDHFGELADISFGDINVTPYNEDKNGINSLVSRNKYWNNLLLEAEKCNYIHLNDLPKDELLRCQGYVKRYKKGGGISALRNLRKLLGCKNPVNDDMYVRPSIKDYVKQLITLSMIAIGKQKFFWFIVKKFDRFKE